MNTFKVNSLLGHEEEIIAGRFSLDDDDNDFLQAYRYKYLTLKPSDL